MARLYPRFWLCIQGRWEWDKYVSGLWMADINRLGGGHGGGRRFPDRSLVDVKLSRWRADLKHSLERTKKRAKTLKNRNHGHPQRQLSLPNTTEMALHYAVLTMIGRTTECATKLRRQSMLHSWNICEFEPRYVTLIRVSALVCGFKEASWMLQVFLWKMTETLKSPEFSYGITYGNE